MTHLQTLIERWKTGDESAAEAIYNLNRTRTYRLAYGLLGNDEDTEEAAQDALTYALVNIDSYDERRSQFTTWLHRITVSRSRDILRKRKVPSISFSDWLRNIGDRKLKETSPEEEVMHVEESEYIWKVVQELSPSLREVIILRHWGGHTYQEIADIVGCPLRTAQSRIRLAYRQIEKQFTATNSGFLLKEIQK